MKNQLLISLLSLFIFSEKLTAAEPKSQEQKTTHEYDQALYNLIKSKNPRSFEYLKKFIELHGNEIDWNANLSITGADSPFLVAFWADEFKKFLELLTNPITKDKIEIDSGLIRGQIAGRLHQISTQTSSDWRDIGLAKSRIKSIKALLLEIFDRGILPLKPGETGEEFFQFYPEALAIYKEWVKNKGESKEGKEIKEQKRD
jgi:hypothetical protein